MCIICLFCPWFGFDLTEGKKRNHPCGVVIFPPCCCNEYKHFVFHLLTVVKVRAEPDGAEMILLPGRLNMVSGCFSQLKSDGSPYGCVWQTLQVLYG